MGKLDERIIADALIGESDVRSQVPGIASQFAHRRCPGAVEQIVMQPLVLEEETDGYT